MSYDLNKSKIIGCKGAQIEILEAANTVVRYRNIKNFNVVMPWVCYRAGENDSPQTKPSFFLRK